MRIFSLARPIGPTLRSFWRKPYAPIVTLIPVVILEAFFLRPTSMEVKLCDTAVSELVGASDQLALDRAKFVIERENCRISKRTDRISDR